MLLQVNIPPYYLPLGDSVAKASDSGTCGPGFEPALSQWSILYFVNNIVLTDANGQAKLKNRKNILIFLNRTPTTLSILVIQFNDIVIRLPYV